MSEFGIIGDDSYGTELPETTVNDEVKQEQLAAARFSKTKEYKLLKEHFDQRIAYYQAFLPDGRAVTSVPKTELEGMWVAANVIIGEFKAVLDAYETANEYAKRESKR